MHNSWIRDLEYVLMPSRSPVKGFEEKYILAYETWRKAWEKFRGEIGIEGKLSADGFLVAHEVGAIFYKGECVGLSAFTHGDLKRGPLPDHSWWNAWPQKDVDELKKISNQVIVCSQFTVNPQFAGKNQIVRWKEILSLLSQLRFLHSDAEAMAGHLNLTRGMQNACGEDNGATVINPCCPFSFYGKTIEAQLVAYERHRLEAMIERRGLGELSQSLWKMLRHVSDYPVTQQTKTKLHIAA